MQSRLRRLLHMDWDAIAGVVAAVIALIMHFLHLIEVEVLTMITLVLIALLFIRGLRKERSDEAAADRLLGMDATLDRIDASLAPHDVVLVGPASLREASARFAHRASGEMVWFHVCLSMFRPQPLFDALLRPAIENERVDRIRFTLDAGQRELWEKEVRPKIEACADGHKVEPPHWGDVQENVSFIASAAESGESRECLLSFWGEPFMSSAVGPAIPRYIFHVQPRSQLVERLLELERSYRLAAR
ncbi:MAG: hypothetical protein R3190_14585 [Thermoanaerobaculia bacterium]|nr:hypothetical protein [Thermoanaerobaculia bacterium]